MARGVETKSAIKRAVKRVLSTAAPMPARGATRILTYHSVGRRDHEMNVTPAAFADQMRWLADHVHVVSLDDAVGGAHGVAITFDDGYRDNLLNAAPLLRKHAFPATVFVVADRLGGFLDHDAEADEARLLNPEELREVRNARIAIGGHSMTHPRLTSLDTNAKRHEIVECKRVLESIVNGPVNAFAYPYGTARDFDAECIAMVRDAGYGYAVSNRYGPNRAVMDRFALRRINIDRTDTVASFAAKVDGRLDGLRFLESDLGLYARAKLNRLLHVG